MNKSIEWGAIVLLAVFLIYFVSPLASGEPDGLEKTAQELNAAMEEPVPFAALGDYSNPITAVVGSVLVFMLVIALFLPVIRKK